MFLFAQFSTFTKKKSKWCLQSARTLHYSVNGWLPTRSGIVANGVMLVIYATAITSAYLFLINS